MAKKVIESKIDSDDFAKLMEANVIKDIREEIKLVLEGQYKYAYEAMMDAYNAGLFVGLVGPVGCKSRTAQRKVCLFSGSFGMR